MIASVVRNSGSSRTSRPAAISGPMVSAGIRQMPSPESAAAAHALDAVGAQIARHVHLMLADRAR